MSSASVFGFVAIQLALRPAQSMAIAVSSAGTLKAPGQLVMQSQLRDPLHPAIRTPLSRLGRISLAFAPSSAAGACRTRTVGLHSFTSRALPLRAPVGKKMGAITLLRTRMSTTDAEVEAPSTGESGKYPFKEIEAKWQKHWEERQTFRMDPDCDKTKPKFYALDMFPYPSGAGLHVGHPEGYTATDILSRYKRMNGYNVMHPMGWDAFGLPAEQYAIQTGTHPAITTEKNINRFREQLQVSGEMFLHVFL